jgi:hypothetical protein
MLWQLKGSTRYSLWTVLVNFVTPWELFLFPIVELGPDAEPSARSAALFLLVLDHRLLQFRPVRGLHDRALV